MNGIDRSSCSAAKHGNEWAYSKHGCRCPDGRDAWRRYSYNRRHGLNPARLIDVSPTATRLRILAALGHDWRSLTRAAGWRSPKQVTDLAYKRQSHVHRGTHALIANVFVNLIAEPVPQGQAAARAINTALRSGWGVVDIEVVNRALRGQQPALVGLERLAVIHIGHARGIPVTAIAAAICAGNHSVIRAISPIQTSEPYVRLPNRERNPSVH